MRFSHWCKQAILICCWNGSYAFFIFEKCFLGTNIHTFRKRVDYLLRRTFLLIFVRPGITNLTLFSKIEQNLRSSATDSEQQLALHNANNITNLCVRTTNERSVFAGSDDRYFRTMSTSHILVYLGDGGLQLKIPFIKHETSSRWPTHTQSISSCVIEIAKVFQVLYCFPALCCERRNSRMSFEGAEMGCTFRW